jgi:hypothetical protein
MKPRRAIFTTAPKGGVGKTYLAKLLYDLLPQHGRKVSAWDLDAATGTFAIYDDGIKTFDLNDARSTSSWLDDCHRDDVDDVLVDVPGGRIDDLLRTFGDDSVAALVDAVADAGREFVVINPIGVMIAETVTAQVTLNAFGGTNARMIVVKNGRFGAADDFVIYDGIGDDAAGRRYGTTGQLAENAGAETLYLPSLAPRLLAQLDAEQLKFIDAAGPSGLSQLGRLGAARVKMYLASVTDAFRNSSLDLDGAIPQRRAAS